MAKVERSVNALLMETHALIWFDPAAGVRNKHGVAFGLAVFDQFGPVIPRPAPPPTVPVKSLKPQVVIFASHLYATYSRLSALREELRGKGLVEK